MINLHIASLLLLTNSAAIFVLALCVLVAQWKELISLRATREQLNAITTQTMIYKADLEELRQRVLSGP